jgi:hypothetical protein
VYELDTTLHLGPLDSNLTITAAPGATVVLSGGHTLEMDCLREGKGPIFYAELPYHLPFEVTQVFVGQERQVRARYPDIVGNEDFCQWWVDGEHCEGFANIAGTLPDFHLKTVSGSNGSWSHNWDNYTRDSFLQPEYCYNYFKGPLVGGSGWRFADNISLGSCNWESMPVASGLQAPRSWALRMAQWNESEISTAVVNVWEQSRWGNFWWGVLKVENGSDIYFDPHKGGWQVASGGTLPLASSPWFYVENVLAECDTPGEWFYQQSTNRLFLIPNTSQPLGDSVRLNVTVAGIEQLVHVDGASHVSLVGLRIRHAGVSMLAHKYEIPSNGDFSFRRAAAVTVENAEHILVDRCSFVDLGGNALLFSRHVVRSNITNNECAYIGENCFVLLGETAPAYSPIGTAETFPSDNLVAKNHGHHVGVYEYNSAGFVQALSCHNTIRNNVFHSSPRSAITLQDHFGGGNHIDDNVIFDVMRSTNDGGPIKMWSRMPYLTRRGAHAPQAGVVPADSVFSRNLILSDYCGAYALDFDDASDNVVVVANVLFKAPPKMLWHAINMRIHQNLIVRPDLKAIVDQASNPGEQKCFSGGCAYTHYASGSVVPSHGNNATYVNNTCIVGLMRHVYSFMPGEATCDPTSPSSLERTMPLSNDNTFLAAAPQNLTATCYPQEYGFPHEWSQLWGEGSQWGDSRSKVGPLPSIEATVQMARAFLSTPVNGHEVAAGLGRIVALHHHYSTLYQIH